MAKIVGISNCSFKGRDGTQVNGSTIHTAEPIDPKRGQGEATDHFFFSAVKLAALDFTPAVGQEVEVLYNRYGKVSALRLQDKGFVID